MSSQRRFLLTALWLGLVLAAAGCGGSDERDDREQIRDVLTESVIAAHAGDEAKACSLYTPAYVRERLRESRGLKLRRDTCDELVRALERVLKQLTRNPRPRVAEVEVAGDKATARMEIQTYVGPAASRFFLVRDDGDWRIDHDQDLQEEPESPGS